MTSPVPQSDMVTLYHRTSPEAAKRILDKGFTGSGDEGVWFSTGRPASKFYGSDILTIQVPRDSFNLDEDRGGGYQWGTVSVRDLKGLKPERWEPPLPTEPPLGLAPAPNSKATPLRKTYLRVKDATNQRAQQIFLNGIDPAEAATWVPEDIAAQSNALGQMVQAAQMLVGNLTSVDTANKFGGKPARVTEAITLRDTGIPKNIEYQRPYWEVAKAMRNGAEAPEALQAGLTRLYQLTDTDLQMAKVRQAQIGLRAVGAKTYRRVTTSDNPCALCEIAATQIYYTDDSAASAPGLLL